MFISMSDLDDHIAVKRRETQSHLDEVFRRVEADEHDPVTLMLAEVEASLDVGCDMDAELVRLFSDDCEPVDDRPVPVVTLEDELLAAFAAYEQPDAGKPVVAELLEDVDELYCRTRVKGEPADG